MITSGSVEEERVSQWRIKLFFFFFKNSKIILYHNIIVDASWNELAKPKHYNKINPDINYELKSSINTGASPVTNVPH